MIASLPTIRGCVPVMLTPFTAEGVIDFDGLGALTEWYLGCGSGALFAVCQSSEMRHLSVDERVRLAKSTVDQCAGRVPVIASGHVAESLDEQISELIALADTGIDALVLVTNRLDPQNVGFDAFRHNLLAIVARLPSDLPLGLYECPVPYRRLIRDEELRLCLDLDRFSVLKDVSCDRDTIKRRLTIVGETGFAIINANAAIAHRAMMAGSQGFAGVFTNFHPDLYAWLYDNKERTDPLLQDLVTFLALSANAESCGYPVLAKLYHQRLGTFTSPASRVISYDVYERHWAIDDILHHIEEGTNRYRKRIAEFETSRT